MRCHHFINYIEPVSGEEESAERARKERRLIRAIESPEYKSLLNEIFTFGSIIDQRSVSSNADEETLNRINNYSLSLQESVRMWFSIFNPTQTNNDNDFNFWLLKINRMDHPGIYPVLLAIMLKCRKNDERKRAFKSIERLMFVERLGSGYYRYAPAGAEILSAAIRLLRGDVDIGEVISVIDERTNLATCSDWSRKQIREAMRTRNFYSWRAIHYLLYEYNLDLQMRSKTSREKIEWEKFIEKEEDYKSIEHIYPQRAQSKYCRENFKGLTQLQRELLKNVVGNLLPLSKPKNSSISNASYREKVTGRSHGVGYAYGSYSENEVSVIYADWTPSAILDRSLKILDFIEERWGISFGKDHEKVEMLGLGFVKPGMRFSPRVHGVSEGSVTKPSPRKPARPR